MMNGRNKADMKQDGYWHALDDVQVVGVGEASNQITSDQGSVVLRGAGIVRVMRGEDIL